VSGSASILSTPSNQVTGRWRLPKLRELWPNRENWRCSPGWPDRAAAHRDGLPDRESSRARRHIISTLCSPTRVSDFEAPRKSSGQGAVAGVAGPESANNAASTGAFVPMLALHSDAVR